ncbi:MAG TPA: ABC transporter permease subunit [Jatrophihabitans sp.]|jgi:ABC-type nitrate/sulfonate/bicarbonate transport system permease component
MNATHALMKLGKTVLTIVISAAVVIFLWWAFLKITNVNQLVAKTPKDVWDYLFTGPDAGANRGKVLHPLWQTVVDAGIGYLFGMLAAFIAALVFVLFRPVEQTLMPVAIVLQSMPIIALAPMLIYIFDRGITGVGVVAGLIVFFPALVTIAFGLRSASKQSAEFCQVYGAGRITIARKVMVPSSMPALFTAARIAVPGAVVGAMIAEWLATGRGLGYAMAVDPNSFDYTHIWASVVAITVTSVVVYFGLGAVETLALTRMGSNQK